MRSFRVLFWHVFSVTALFCIQASSQSISFSLGTKGLTSLTYGSSQLIAAETNGALSSLRAGFKRANGTSYDTAIGLTYSLASAENIVSNTNAKVVFKCRYVKVSDSRLDFCIVVQNTSTDTFTSANGQLAALTSSVIPQFIGTSCNMVSCGDGTDFLRDVSAGDAGGWNNNSDGGPQISLFGLGTFCNLAVCNLSNPLSSNSWSGRSNVGTKFVIFTFQLSQHVAPNGFSDTCKISFRFDTAGTLTTQRLSTLCADAAMLYGGGFPSHLNWPDRRPLGECNLSSYDESKPTPATNPSRWGQPSPIGTIDVTTTSGLENFRSWVLGWGNTCISNTRKMNGQGIITWDIEGSRYLFDGTNYAGDPDMATTIAPEWNFKGAHSDSIIDEFFKNIRDAGMVPGLCIRPQKFVITNGKSTQKDETSGIDPGQEIFNDIDYAYKRWGVRIFYMDSNVYNGGTTITAKDILQKTLSSHPDVLIAGEWETYNYFQWSGVYDQVAGGNLPNGVYNTPASVRMVYPDAVSMIFFGGFSGQFFPVTSFISGARKGDIYLANSWYASAEIDSIIKINGILGTRPKAAITSPSNGTSSATTVTINATASDSGANAGVDSVEFLSAGIKIGVDKTAPYSFTWTNVLPGKHSLYARAIDKNKNSACSQPVNITVIGPPVAAREDFKISNQAIAGMRGPLSVCVYSTNGRLIQKIDFKDPAHFVPAQAIKGLSAGIYVLKVKHANGTIVKRKIEAVW